MRGHRLVLLLTIAFLAVPLTGCFGDEEQPPADPGTGGNTTDPGTGGNTTDPGTGGNTTNPGIPTTPAKPAPVNETLTLSVPSPGPGATGGTATATTTSAIAPGFATCKLTFTTNDAMAPVQSVDFAVTDSAGTAIATATVTGTAPGGPGVPASSATVESCTAPAATGPWTITATGKQQVQGLNFNIQVEILY